MHFQHDSHRRQKRAAIAIEYRGRPDCRPIDSKRPILIFLWTEIFSLWPDSTVPMGGLFKLDLNQSNSRCGGAGRGRGGLGFSGMESSRHKLVRLCSSCRPPKKIG
jgi:hypothetical protein